VLPASSGIPYLFYSRQTNTPISVGHPSNNSNDKLLMARAADGGSMWGASWDFIPAANGFVVIQSTDVFGQGNSGVWWDMFNYTTQVGANNRTSMARYEQLPRQHFKIVPAGSGWYFLSDIKYVNQWSARVVNYERQAAAIVSHVNNTNGRQEPNLTIRGGGNENYHFRENVKNISFSFFEDWGWLGIDEPGYKPPRVKDGKVFLDTDENTDIELLYRPNLTQTIRKDLTTTVPIVADPNTKIDVHYFYSIYDIEVEYEAITLIAEDRELKVGGTLVARIFVDDLWDEQFHTQTDLRTGQTRTIRPTPGNEGKRIPF
jgi:hypothetical protein